MSRCGAIEDMTRNQIQIFCVIKCIEASQVTSATHFTHPFITVRDLFYLSCPS